MARLEELQPGVIVKGILPDKDKQITVIEAVWHANIAVGIIYKDSIGGTGNILLYRSAEPNLEIVTTGASWKFDADGEMFRLVSEARRIQLAHLFDPRLAVHTSEVQPFPHQITAVYEEMLPRQPLRYLLADDPGAGKTIMTGLYLKELLVRGDLERCLIVCLGSLVEQWQGELYQRFHLPFEILTRDRINNAVAGNPFQKENFLICRLDQLSRNNTAQAKLKTSNWDVIVCDEAHKMSASFSGGEIKATKRYRLGELLGNLTRHFLLLTATPHNGKEADFQLFMALLDPDRFEGRFRDGVHTVDTSDLMRRMVKEDLLEFDGSRLFPERYAYTINYALSELEKQLYDEVTEYVRKEMNRADEIKGQRRNRIGFALTILQRRLASSPEAIYCSIQRRRERLEERLQEEMERKQNADAQLKKQAEMTEVPTNAEDVDYFYDGTPAEEVEAIEEEIVARASAARTIAELQAEIQTLQRLEKLALNVRQSGRDRKWEELSNLLKGESDASAAKEMFDTQGHRRKLIIFTEHRDTLRYLTERVQTLIGSPKAVCIIHGSIRSEDRQKVQEDFMNDPEVQILIATDAAGEGINLQCSHLMVNYDLPWNPNRIEQRFGRIHRIGQTEVCHLWNLVASETREGQVFITLLYKLEQQRDALGGAVFDVLGKCFIDAPLRNLLIEAIREGDKPEVKERLAKVIDGVINQEHLQKLIKENHLAHGFINMTRLGNIREEMERAEVYRLQPHFVATFFHKAFVKLGGKLQEYETGRYEVKYVPDVIRNYNLGIKQPISHSYDRITFEKRYIEGKPAAEFVCPGHPLLDATVGAILDRRQNLLRQGSVLVDENERNSEVRVLFYLEHSIQDGQEDSNGKQRVISRQMQFVEINGDKKIRIPGYAPYLDYRPITEDERAQISSVLEAPWLRENLESEAEKYAIEHLVETHLNEVKVRREHLVQKTMDAVDERLNKEINYWNNKANEYEQQAKIPKMVVESIKQHMKDNNEELTSTARANLDEALQPYSFEVNRCAAQAGQAKHLANEMQTRLENRMKELRAELHILAVPPVVTGGALIVPQSLLDVSGSETSVSLEVSQADRERIDKLAIAAVMEAERSLEREPKEKDHHNPGCDIESKDPNTNQLLFIEVKGKTVGATNVTVSKTQILAAFNKPDNFILAIVEINGETAEKIHYIQKPFQSEPDFEVTSVNYSLNKLLERATLPR